MSNENLDHTDIQALSNGPSHKNNKINPLEVSKSFAQLERVTKLEPRDINIVKDLIYSTINMEHFPNFSKRF